MYNDDGVHRGARMKRGKMEVIFDMLQVVHDKGGSIKPTHLLYKANLSHDAMKRYVTELMEKEFLEERTQKGKKVYALTDQGYKFLEEYRKFSQFAESFGI